MNLRLKRPQTLWGQFLIIFPLTIALDIFLDLRGFRVVLVEVLANPASWWELLLLLVYWAVDAFIFALVFHFLFRRFIRPHQEHSN
jgi:hypothetical protein